MLILSPPLVLTGVIDPGHGGKDLGAIGANQLAVEKELTLSYALLLEKKLVARGHKITLTRRDDSYLSLAERVKIERNIPENDFFLSIHFDASVNPAAHGTWGFFYNRVVVEGGGYHVTDVTQTPSILGQALAGALVEQIVARARTNNRGTQPRPLYRYDQEEQKWMLVEKNLYVLRYTRVPAVLVEIEFLTNPAAERRVLNENFRDLVTDGIVAGLELWGQMYLKG